MRLSDEGKQPPQGARHPPPRPRRAGVVSDVRLTVRFTPQEEAVIGSAASRAGLTLSQFIRQTVLLAASDAADSISPQPPLKPMPIEAAAAVLSGVRSGPKGDKKRVVLELPAAIAEALSFGAKAAKMKKNEVTTAALLFLGQAHQRGELANFAGGIFQAEPDPILIRRAAVAAQALAKMPRSQWTKAQTSRGQITLRSGQIRDFRAGAKLAGLSVSEFSTLSSPRQRKKALIRRRPRR